MNNRVVWWSELVMVSSQHQ